MPSMNRILSTNHLCGGGLGPGCAEEGTVSISSRERGELHFHPPSDGVIPAQAINLKCRMAFMSWSYINLHPWVPPPPPSLYS